MPTNPKIYRIRKDLSWAEVLRNHYVSSDAELPEEEPQFNGKISKKGSESEREKKARISTG